MANELSPNQPSISALILAHNEESMIVNCLDTVAWCDEVIVLDHNSSDATAGLAKRAGARVVSIKKASEDFAELRNLLLEHAKTDWVLYLDADERVTPRLFQEILVNIETATANALSFNRKNYFYGQEMMAGGWQIDTVTRVFKRSALRGWSGKIHESPDFDGKPKLLHTELLHFTHRNTQDGLVKSSDWTKREAQLLVEAGIESVKVSTLVRKCLMEFWRRLIIKKGYQDGIVGWIEAMVQAANKLFVYIQVWELQQRPGLSEQYRKLDEDIIGQWQHVKLP